MQSKKSVVAVLLLSVSLGLAAQAQVLRSVIAGSPTMWQALALAAYNNGSCVAGGTPNCSHYTSSVNFTLTDIRPFPFALDTGRIWIVWDGAASPHVWMYLEVDSSAGTRCFFAQPRCRISIPTFPIPGQQIGAALWGNDTLPPLIIQNLFTIGAGVLVNTAATDIRPEDAMFDECRANSVLGGGTDGLAGLGYGTNAPGVCPTFASPLAQKSGAPILSGYPGSAGKANVVAFNISGKDPFTNTTIPVSTTVSVGAAPIVFITNRSGALAPVTGATDAQLQTVFSGTNCDAAAFGAPPGAIEAYLRDPVSATMNVTEYTVFRYPNVTGISQETGVSASNPLAAAPCAAGGNRYRAIGGGEEVKSVQNSNINNAHDGIGYTFFSYSQVAAIANNANYGYLQLDGVDPIFQLYGSTLDPGQPATPGVLPSAANLPAACAGAFPCPESQIWAGHLSFPNLRFCCYRAWSVLRLVSNGPGVGYANALAQGSRTVVINQVPDYIPFNALGTDPGLRIIRSHYTQEGIAPINVVGTGDRGGDQGGCIIIRGPAPSNPTGLIQQAPGTGCVTFP